MIDFIGQDTIIMKFVEHFADSKGFPIRITCWPDKYNSASKDVDAIAEGGGVKFAIEHTTLDAVEKEREIEYRDRIIGVLWRELKGVFVDNIVVILPFEAVPIGSKGLKLKVALKEGLIRLMPTLPYGCANFTVPGLPYQVCIQKYKSESPSFWIAYRPPENDKHIISRIFKQINGKVSKLKPYGENNFETILLLEQPETLFLDSEAMQVSIKSSIARGLAFVPHQIWYADTRVLHDFRFVAI